MPGTWPRSTPNAPARASATASSCGYPDLSAGLYVLDEGATDPQAPHSEDELYHVVSGRARFTAGDETREVRAGSLVFVAARVPHRFHDITERLQILVVFGPAEDSRR